MVDLACPRFIAKGYTSGGVSSPYPLLLGQTGWTRCSRCYIPKKSGSKELSKQILAPRQIPQMDACAAKSSRSSAAALGVILPGKKKGTPCSAAEAKVQVIHLGLRPSFLYKEELQQIVQAQEPISARLQT